MRSVLVLGVAAAALLAAGAAQAAPSVEIKSAVARVVVVPQARPDVKVVMQSTSAQLPLTVRTEGDKTIVDGGLSRPVGGDKIKNCMTINGRASVTVAGVGKVAWDSIPQVIVYVPMDAKVGASGAVFGSVGRTDKLELSNAGCGDWTIGNVAGEMKINLAGSGDVKAGTSGTARINIAGSGDAEMGAVRGDLSIQIAGSGDVAAGAVGGALSTKTGGSGDVEVASVNGQVSTSTAGSGDVQIRGGRATALAVSTAGSGDVLFGGVADSVSAKIAGSGDVRVGKVNGSIAKSVVGSGEVVIGRVDFDD